ncbi:hypothetical protein AVEN_87487-1 [Araneus ventricosus]|uniref:Uncharacterized protein n=1 Tax=Araneus ventricosus TaxID=182803 RepID=A0A4Y2JF76_ARAVE|nr:hypothetical protein AVEN_87487-1 [Araneus ventricosus]
MYRNEEGLGVFHHGWHQSSLVQPSTSNQLILLQNLVMRCMDSSLWIFSAYARHDRVFAAQIKVGPGGGWHNPPLSLSLLLLFSELKTSLSETDDNKIPVTDPKRMIPSSKGQLEGGRRNGILQFAQHRDPRG